MFGSRSRKKSGGLFGVIRMLISLMMILLLSFGGYLAYRSFSGVDPLKINSRNLVSTILSSEKLYSLVTDLLTLSPDKSLQKLKDISSGSPATSTLNQTPVSPQKPSLQFRFAVVADSHADNASLSKALAQAKREQASFVIGLGDYSDVGTIAELESAKAQFDQAGLPYYLTAGDHDLWDSRDKKSDPLFNFQRVMGSPYQSFTHQDIKFVIVFNSDNYLGINEIQMKWLEEELARAVSEQPKTTFLLTHLPLFHPSSDHVMGKLEPKLKEQAQKVINLAKQASVSELFFGDTHFYASFSEPESGLKMTVVGAASSLRNAQAPRFALVDVYSDGSYNISDIEIK